MVSLASHKCIEQAFRLETQVGVGATVLSSIFFFGKPGFAETAFQLAE